MWKFGDIFLMFKNFFKTGLLKVLMVKSHTADICLGHMGLSFFNLYEICMSRDKINAHHGTFQSSEKSTKCPWRM